VQVPEAPGWSEQTPKAPSDLTQTTFPLPDTPDTLISPTTCKVLLLVVPMPTLPLFFY